MRFVRQRDNFTCGPVSIFNALKWAGFSSTYKQHFFKIKFYCKTTYDWGTTPENITKTLSKYSKYLSFSRKELITLKEIDVHLNNGGAIILEYWFKEANKLYDGHYVFIFRENEHDFIAVNGMEGPLTVQPCPRNMLKGMLRCRKYRHTGSPSAWLINKA